MPDISPLNIALAITMFPLLGTLVAGFLGSKIGRTATHRIAVTCVGIAFLLSCYLFYNFIMLGQAPVDGNFYIWASAGILQFNIGYLLDNLSITMSVVVLFVSFMVHIYTIGYMADDPGYNRFFSYVSLFTFFMLVLVFANNFLLIFFGWEGVGLVSYLLIGFWFTRDSATAGSLKAFLANRIGDIGFLLAIAAILLLFGTINYTQVFAQVPQVVGRTINLFPHYQASAITVICVLLFIGAMGKSAQVPLHVWLPESMEGPTPISALIHAATMVTAGIYMVARMSPLFERSPEALSLVLIIGGTTAFFMGLLAITQYDIKRVIAYSTISQLGYMAVALGASAYNAAIFHLVTHAFFKALLFLGAGSVIIAMHHEQDMRKMGGLYSYLPITYFTFVIGSLALCAIPPFSGFFSKDMIIDAVSLSHTPGARYAYYCVLAGAFVTPLYSFRALFMTFHGPERMDAHTKEHLHEPSWVVTLPLILLAIPSTIAGLFLIRPFLFNTPTLLGNSTFVLPEHNVLAEIGSEFQGASMMALKAASTLTFWLSIAGIITAWLVTLGYPAIAEFCKTRFSFIYNILVRKYGFDDFNQAVFVDGTRALGETFYKDSDVKVIDAGITGSGKVIRFLAQTGRKLQSGYIYHYALAMVLGIVAVLAWYIWG